MARKREPDQLDKDSTAAWKANMSYGKWKALQWEKAGMPAIRKEEEPVGNTICRYCGKAFTTTSPNKGFCSDECNFAHQGMKRRERSGQG